MAEWLRRTFSEDDGWPSSRRQLYALALVWALGLATGLLAKGHVDAVVKLTESALWCTAGAVTIGKFAEPK